MINFLGEKLLKKFMFQNRKSILFIFFLSFLFSLYADNPVVKTLSLSFERKETTKDNQTSIIKGSIFYQQYPYVFVFQIEEPEPEFIYGNYDGAFMVEDGETYGFSDEDDFLNQTCSDILNLFKSDFGIFEAGYKVKYITAFQNLICASSYYVGEDDFYIVSAQLYKNSVGNYCKLEMFDIEKELIESSEFSDYIHYNGFKFPQTVVTKYYSENLPDSVVELKISQVVINQIADNKFSSEEYEPVENQNMSVTEKRSIAQIPESQKYNVSTTSILVHTAYDFYKKYITDQDIPGCAFSPTCSSFMTQSIKAHGLWGIVEGLDHLRRCSRHEVNRNIYARDKNGLIIEEVK